MRGHTSAVTDHADDGADDRAEGGADAGGPAADGPADPGEQGAPAVDADVQETTEFLLDDWSVEDRALLDRLLTGEAVPHAWQGGTLVVPTVVQYEVDELIDQVELTAGAVDELDEAVEGLTGDEVDDGPGDGHGADDEWGDEDLDDGVDAQEVLGEAFVAADRLAKRAKDPEGVLALVDVHAAMISMALPFGFDEAVWDDLVAAVGRLATALTSDGDGPEDLADEHIEELAGDLRARLRPLV